MKNLDSASPNPQKDNFPRAPKIYSGQEAKPTPVVNLLKDKNEGKKAGRGLKLFLWVLGLAILILAGLIFGRAASLSEKIFSGQTTTFFGKVWEAIRGVSGHITLEGENKGQVNILLLGIGGPGHEGPYLTDTMILAQIRPKTSEVAFISIPRDLLSELPSNLGPRKINAVFAEGIAREKDQNEAGRWSRMAVERLSGQTIPYFAVVDFEGFKKAVDEVKGLDIYVERDFTDSQFPDEKLGYLPPLTFKQGLEHMGGQRALQYARSRHGTNGEASDFARSVRQQKVIKAFKEKILGLNLITGIGQVNNLLEIFADNFYTNLRPGEIFRLYDIVKEQNIQTFLSLSLDPETGLLCATSQETAGYILVPCEGKTSRDLENFFKNAFVLGKLREEKSVIWLANSTAEAKIYTENENKLKAGNLTVWQLNYGDDPLAQTIVYQVNPKPATLEYVKNVLGAKEVSLPPPGVKVDPAKVDMIVILGKNN